MPLGSRLLTLLERARPLSGSNFRLAVTLGFTIAAVGVVSLSVGQRASVADSLSDFFGGSSSFFGQFAQPQPQMITPTYREAAQPRRRVHARRHDGEAPRPVRFDGSVGRDDAPAQLGRVSMCVRLCDGFAFPVGAYHGSQDTASHEATCQSECPDARTSLYVLPSGAGSIDEATDVHTGRGYSALPDAYHYTTVLSDSCSCHAKSGGRIASLLHDFTLRRGDAVMTKRGFQIFHGGTSFPHKRRDFVALAKSPDIQRNKRDAYRAIERASLVVPRTIAEAPPAPVAQKLAEADTTAKGGTVSR